MKRDIYMNFVGGYINILNQLGGKKKEKKWTKLIHQGCLFPPPYQPHQTPVLVNEKEFVLSPEAEEMATVYAKYIDSEYITNRTFKKNFWNDWKTVLKVSDPLAVANSLDDYNFDNIYKYILNSKLKSDDNIAVKEKIKRIETEHSKVLIDDMEQTLGNFRMEPPGIFIGRGCHPLLGTYKKRITPADITLNLSKDAPIPQPHWIDKEGNMHIINEEWGGVVHDPMVEWVASWHDVITGKMKYIWLSDSSHLKSENDYKKFELARKLKRRIGRIREENNKMIQSDDMKDKQLGLCFYLIDNLALRVGNEKDENSADTVGVVSLRIEHVQLKDNQLMLDFLGKDSIRYTNEVMLEPFVWDAMLKVCEGKSANDEIFDMIKTTTLNQYLQQHMKDLTAKVFRTYNASNLFQKELDKVVKKLQNNQYTENDIMDGYNAANIKVARLCNHKKKAVASFSKQIEKMKEMIKKLRAKKRRSVDPKKIDTRIQILKAKMNLKTELKDISLSTSKVNYIDPRISIAFFKKMNLPVDRFFAKKLQDKFKWALDVEPDFKF